jgi:cytochrome c biogenesis protein CcmG/thiol:disulfide interchange protein DsbE
MKKGVPIGLGVMVLLAIMVWADRKFPAAGKAAGPGTNASATSDGSLPNLAIKNVEDKDVSLGQYKGQVVLVNFWATWCEPCKIEIPWMIEFQNKYRARGFTILGLSMDDEGKKVVAPFLQNERFDVDGQKAAMNYPILLANDSIAEQFGGLIGLPTSMLFTRDGKKIKTIVGLVNHDDIEKAITSLL